MEYEDSITNYQQPFSNNDNLIDNRRYASQYNQMNIHPHHHPPIHNNNNHHHPIPSSNIHHNQGVNYNNHPPPSYNHNNNNRMSTGDVNINFYDDYCLTPNTLPYKPDPRYPNPLENGGSHRKQKSVPSSNIN